MLKQRLRQLSIRWKIVLITATTCVVVLVGIALFLLPPYFAQYRAQAKRELTTLAKMTSQNVSSAILFEDQEAAQEVLTALRVVPRVLTAGILLPDGSTLARYLSSRNQLPYLPPPDYPRHRIVEAAGTTITAFIPVRHGAETLGTLFVHYDLSPMYLRMKASAFRVGVVILVGVGLAVLLSYRLQHLVSESILTLTGLIRRITRQQDFSIRAETQAEDEVAELMSGFNHMLDLIQQRDRELLEHRDNLELEVQERTRELDRKNRDLQEEMAERQRVAESLRRRVEIEATMTTVATRFLSLEQEQLTPGVDEALQDVGELIEVDSAFVFTFSSASGEIDMFRSWRAEDGTVRTDLQGMRLDELAWCKSLLEEGREVVFNRREDLPDEAEGARSFFEARGTEAMLCVPMMYQKKLFGGVGVSCIGQPREWTEEEMYMMRLFTVIVLDTLERQWGERERERLEKQIRQAQKLESLGVLTGGIAHDFNNLLMSILGNAELVEEEVDEPETVESMQNIQTAAKHAADLCRQMLAYSGQGRIVIQSVDVNHVLESLSGLLKTSISKKAELRFELAESLPQVQADVSQIRQVALNLISNSAEAIGDNVGTITVRTYRQRCTAAMFAKMYLAEELSEGEYVVLEVVDDGAGMSAETLERIFDPFFTTKFTGRGLGLAAVLGIVRSHSAALNVRTRRGQGTTFTIYLPAEVAKHEEEQQPLEGEPPRRVHEGTVLFAEDEDMVRFTVSRMVSKLGFDVLEAKDGVEAVERMRENGDAVRLVILDLNMPRMGGMDALREIRSFNKEVPVLLSSGYSEEESTKDVLEYDLAGFVEKPYTMDRLVHAIETALAKGDES